MFLNVSLLLGRNALTQRVKASFTGDMRLGYDWAGALALSSGMV